MARDEDRMRDRIGRNFRPFFRLAVETHGERLKVSVFLIRRIKKVMGVFEAK